jgi:hypothetical protein
MAKTLLERFIAQLNANVFFAEFAFDSAQLRVPGTGDIELADHLVLLDEIGLIFQLKERNSGAALGATELTSWFTAKVRKKAVSQIAASRTLLRHHAGATIPNQRGHLVQLPDSSPDRLAAVVIYDAPQPEGFNPPQYCVSGSAGFVHFIKAADYLGVCQSLITPTEVQEYLAFRQQAMRSLVFAPASVSEAALVGQFMGGDLTAIPNEKYSRAHHALLDDREEWDVSFLTERLGQQITYREGDQSQTSHYRILAELAKLTRSELKELKSRLQLTLEAVATDQFRLPYRFAVPRTDCGFLLFPVPSDLHGKARTALHNFSVASKHELEVSKHIALSVRKTDGYIDIEWMYLAGPVEPNAEVDALLAENYPFRPVRSGMRPRYKFASGEFRDAIAEDGCTGGL